MGARPFNPLRSPGQAFSPSLSSQTEAPTRERGRTARRADTILRTRAAPSRPGRGAPSPKPSGPIRARLAGTPPAAPRACVLLQGGIRTQWWTCGRSFHRIPANRHPWKRPSPRGIRSPFRLRGSGGRGRARKAFSFQRKKPSHASPPLLASQDRNGSLRSD